MERNEKFLVLWDSRAAEDGFNPYVVVEARAIFDKLEEAEAERYRESHDYQAALIAQNHHGMGERAMEEAIRTLSEILDGEPEDWDVRAGCRRDVGYQEARRMQIQADNKEFEAFVEQNREFLEADNRD
jgi:hypothetical protein